MKMNYKGLKAAALGLAALLASGAGPATAEVVSLSVGIASNCPYTVSA